MADLLSPLEISPIPQRRAARLSAGGKPLGRPPGAKSKRSLDLAKYIEATFAGATPGQQSAQLCMVTPKDLRQAKALARELHLVDIDLDPLTLAMVVKATQLARALGIDRASAWILLQKERADLMPYVHQRRAQKSDDAGDTPAATLFVMEGAEPRELGDFSGSPENVEDFAAEPE